MLKRVTCSQVRRDSVGRIFSAHSKVLSVWSALLRMNDPFTRPGHSLKYYQSAAIRHCRESRQFNKDLGSDRTGPGGRSRSGIPDKTKPGAPDCVWISSRSTGADMSEKFYQHPASYVVPAGSTAWTCPVCGASDLVSQTTCSNCACSDFDATNETVSSTI